MKITEYIKKKPFLYRVFSPLVKVVSSFLYQLSTRIPRFIEMRVLPICRMLGGRKDTQKIKELKDIHKGKKPKKKKDKNMNYKSNQKTVSKQAVNTLNVNELNIPIKRRTLAEQLKTRSVYAACKRLTLDPKINTV